MGRDPHVAIPMLAAGWLLMSDRVLGQMTGIAYLLHRILWKVVGRWRWYGFGACAHVDDWRLGAIGGFGELGVAEGGRGITFLGRGMEGRLQIWKARVKC